MNIEQIAFLGAGNIAEAIIAGLIKSDRDIRTKLLVSDIRKERLTYISHKFGIRTTDNNIRALQKSDIIVLSVKPRQITGLLNEISEKILPSQIVVSVAAGITIDYIEKILEKTPVIRAMPNTPVLVGRGMIAVCRGLYASKQHEETVIDLFKSAGKVVSLPEKYFDAVTAMSGSGPAYVFYLAEAMISAGEKIGMEKETSQLLVKQTIAGAAEMLAAGSDDPAALRFKVTSPGGTTESAIKFLESKGFISIIQEAVKRAKMKSAELTK